MSTLTASTTQVAFPAGTPDADFVFTLTGTNPDGSAASASFTSAGSSFSVDLSTVLQVGAVVSLVVSKTIGGTTYSSLPSDPFTVQAETILLAVPDGSQKASIA